MYGAKLLTLIISVSLLLLFTAAILLFFLLKEIGGIVAALHDVRIHHKNIFREIILNVFAFTKWIG